MPWARTEARTEKMKGKTAIVFSILVALLIIVLAGTLKIFLDPYYHREKVSLAVFLAREIDELIRGERSQGKY